MFNQSTRLTHKSALVFLVGSFVPWLPRAAGDVVIVSTKAERNARVTGEIVELTGAGVVIRRGNGRDETIPGSKVIEVLSSWTEHHRQADLRFDRREYRPALVGYRQAMREEPRRWAKRRIAARLVWCNRYLGQVEQAGQMFKVLYRSDPTTRDFAAIPLAWTTERIDAQTDRLAQQWLLDKASSVAQLMAASWLLSTSSRPACLETLKRLSSHDDARIAFLAEAQLWRTQTASASGDEVARWSARVDRMPPTIQAGPCFVLATGLSHHDAFDSAALAYLRIPILHPKHRRLSAQALLGAANQLEKLGQASEAQGLYREILVDYADDPSAVQSRQKFEGK